MIQVKNLSKSYGNLQVLRDIDLSFAEGEFVSLVGPSGSGKSTLLGLLAGLDQATSGAVTIDGQELGRLDEEALARFRGANLGFVFQAYHLIPTLTALENIALPLELKHDREAWKRAQIWLERVGLGDRADHLPRQLSGGEQQRVAIARALVAEPKVLFADEPTGNLDSANGAKILDLILSLRGRVTTVLVTHDPALAARADRTIALKDGRIANVSSTPSSR